MWVCLARTWCWLDDGWRIFRCAQNDSEVQRGDVILSEDFTSEESPEAFGAANRLGVVHAVWGGCAWLGQGAGSMLGGGFFAVLKMTVQCRDGVSRRILIHKFSRLGLIWPLRVPTQNDW